MKFMDKLINFFTKASIWAGAVGWMFAYWIMTTMSVILLFAVLDTFLWTWLAGAIAIFMGFGMHIVLAELFEGAFSFFKKVSHIVDRIPRQTAFAN
jgi:hypothetical protein